LFANESVTKWTRGNKKTGKREVKEGKWMKTRKLCYSEDDRAMRRQSKQTATLPSKITLLSVDSIQPPIPCVSRSVCLFGRCTEAKRLIGSGCRFGWWVGLVEGWVY